MLTETCDPKGSDNNEPNAASNDAASSRILSAEIFDGEDVPSPDIFLQKKSTRLNFEYEVVDEVFDSEDATLPTLPRCTCCLRRCLPGVVTVKQPGNSSTCTAWSLDS